jgi:release factor glutamine methyltransferase
MRGPVGMSDIWTIQTALDWTVGYLTKHGDEHPRRSAEWLLSEATALSRVELYAYFDRPLTQDERAVLRGGVRRRGEGEPLQYLTGEVAFRHIVVKTKRGILIPRPETEILVQEGIDYLAGKTVSPATFHAIDLCTGTGCIALSLARESESVRIVATDIDPVAVTLARENTLALGFHDRVEVLECDLGDSIDEALLGTFDLVISNPPYIPTAELSALPKEVSDFESVLALDGGSDGLEVFRRIVSFSREALLPGGMLAVELYETCLEQAQEYVLAEGYTSARIVRDLTGRDRVLVAYKNHNSSFV